MTDEQFFKMFDKWPCNVFKPESHLLARHDEMSVVGNGLCDGYKGVVSPRHDSGEWVVALSCGARWAYRSLSEMLVDWRIARTREEYRRPVHTP